MNIFNITPLISLLNQTAAQLAFKDKAKPIADKGLNQAVKQLIDEETQDNLNQAAKIVKQLYNNTQEAIDEENYIIEEATAAIELANTRISSLTRAKKYGEKTNNFLPLVTMLEENIVALVTGNNKPKINMEQFCVPVDFNEE